MQELVKIISKFSEKRIGVIGDLMFDEYILGEVKRICPEAPSLLVLENDRIFMPGGAGNTAANLSALGAEVSIFGIVGEDQDGFLILSNLSDHKINVNGVFKSKERPTTRKTRVIVRGQQLIRIDREANYFNSDIEDKIFFSVANNLNALDAIVISDYCKGVISESLMGKLIKLCKSKGKIIIGDTKPRHMTFFKGVTMLTPNVKEAEHMAGMEGLSNLEKIGNLLMRRLNANILITLGSKGSVLFEKRKKMVMISTKAKDVYNVSGAGDTVVSALTLALASGATFFDAARIANLAAGIVVEKVGTTAVTINELRRVLER